MPAYEVWVKLSLNVIMLQNNLGVQCKVWLLLRLYYDKLILILGRLHLKSPLVF